MLARKNIINIKFVLQLNALPSGITWQCLFPTGGYWTSRQPRASGSERLPGQLHDITNHYQLFFCFFLNYELTRRLCVCHVLQGVKGALGDPGLPGPTGIRGEFGERVSLTCAIILNVSQGLTSSDVIHDDNKIYSIINYSTSYSLNSSINHLVYEMSANSKAYCNVLNCLALSENTKVFSLLA